MSKEQNQMNKTLNHLVITNEGHPAESIQTIARP